MDPIAVGAIAENIDAVEFLYTMKTGAPTLVPAPLSDIRAVTISLLARGSRTDSENVDNRVYNFNSGATWGPAGDKFHRRLLVTTIQCRNLGL